jgi:hypothetical protein
MIRTLAAASALLALVGPARGSGTPMDQARFDAWTASHIIIADSSGKMLEVWKGDMKVGDALPVDEKAWRLRLPQVIRHGGVQGSEVEGKKVHADRVILFLSKAPPNSPDGKKPGEWVGLRPFFVSAGKAGVFAQVYVLEDGVQPVYQVAKSEAEFKAEYLPIAERRTALDAALAEPDLKKRAAELAPFASGMKGVLPEAIAALGDCGEAGVVPLAAILFRKDWSAAPLAAESARKEALEALVKIGKPAAGELVKFLELQRAYWTVAAPDLRPDWYTGTSGQDVSGAQLRLLFAALADPAAYADVPADARAVVRDLHELWAKTPVLAGVKTAGDLHPAKLTGAVLGLWDKK